MQHQDDLDIRLARVRTNFAEHLGARMTLATPDRVEFEMKVTSFLANTNGVLHGGAIMGLADNVGGVATILNLPENRNTTTIESKTNFMRPVRMGKPCAPWPSPCIAARPHRSGRRRSCARTTRSRRL